MKPFYIIVLTALAFATAAARAADTNGDLLGIAFLEAQSASVAKIDGSSKAIDAFHGYRLTSEWRRLDANSRSEVAASLRKRVSRQIALLGSPGDEPITLTPFCFDPGYAVRLVTKEGERDFVICLKCAFLYVYDSKGHDLGMDVDPVLLTELKAAYLDEFVLEEGLEKSPNQSTDPTPASVTPVAGQPPRQP
jgi:hypothetical protein